MMDFVINRNLLRIGILAAASAVTQAPGEPAEPDVLRAGLPKMFAGSNQCIACHNDLHTATGEDVSISADWRSSMMAHSAADPYWQAAVRRETIEHPAARRAIQDECAKCHMPMSRFRAHAAGTNGEIFAHLPLTAGQPGLDRKAPTPAGQLAAEGVSCVVCHQILPDKLGREESFTGGFEIDTATPAGRRRIFGPYEVDQGRRRVMQSASTFVPEQHTHIQRSAFCASCHTLYTHTLGPDGEVIGELPEQVPYLEWRHSRYPRSESCQDCHMPELNEPTEITSTLGRDRHPFSRHTFRGGNFFMLRLLRQHRELPGVTAPAADLQTTTDRTIQHLQTQSARLEIKDPRLTGGELRFILRVRNLAGHKLPTAYPSRRCWLDVTVRDDAGKVLFRSGALQPDGSLAGNRNDRDPRQFEPHYRVIRRPEEVQIYEAIMATEAGEVTTGLLSAVRFIKDNRVLPEGFQKGTAADDIAVQGEAAADASFADGADEVLYLVEAPEEPRPLRVEARLYYQPIGFRWAHNLAPFDAAEPQRFLSLYQAMSTKSALVLAEAAATVKPESEG